MTFANLTLLFGGLLIAIPIVLHLTMRQRPQRQLFPALRFLQERRESNRRRLQIRHWLLLCLRAAAIGLAAAALARPSVAAASVGRWILILSLAGLCLAFFLAAVLAAVSNRGRWWVGSLAAIAAALLLAVCPMAALSLSQASALTLGDERAPVAAVLVFDTSPRMDYRFQNETRLQAAQEMASWLLAQLPQESDVAIVTADPEPVLFSIDLSAAQKAVERLVTSGMAQRLGTVLENAVGLLRESPQLRKEVYLFTDLSEAAWGSDAARRIHSLLDSAEEVALYVIDLGVDTPLNRSLGSLQLSAERLVQHDELRIETEVESIGQAASCTVELYLEEPDEQRPMLVDGQMKLPVARRRDLQQLELSAGERRRIEFRFGGLELGVHQGYAAITGEDALAVDDIRYFTIEVTEAWPVLVVAGPEAVPAFLTQSIAPDEYRRKRQVRFECRVVPQSGMSNQKLADFAIVCLLDPAALPPSQWESLVRYAENGGTVATFLGRNALGKSSRPPATFHSPAAISLLGGKLASRWRAPDRSLHLAPQRYDHPMLAAFRQQAASVPWHWSPVHMHWVMDDLNDRTSVVARYSNNKPAILETTLGKGRAVTMTAPISDAQLREGRPGWLELSRSDWPYFVLLNELFRYLVEGGTSSLNYLAGETVVLSNDPLRHPQRYQLFPPSGQLQDVLAGAGVVTIKYTELAGAYRLKGYRGQPVLRGFSINIPAHHSDLTRLSRPQLDELLGAGRYGYARDRQEIELEVGQGRRGREFYPVLIVILALVLGSEHLLANRFY